jgi:arginyl-tRNA synthetase
MGGFRPELLGDRHDRDVLRALAELPSRTVSREPRWAAYLEQVATAYHDAHEHAPAIPMGDQPVEPIHTARLWLAEAVRIVMRSLAGGALPDRL